MHFLCGLKGQFLLGGFNLGNQHSINVMLVAYILLLLWSAGQTAASTRLRDGQERSTGQDR